MDYDMWILDMLAALLVTMLVLLGAAISSYSPTDTFVFVLFFSVWILFNQMNEGESLK